MEEEIRTDKVEDVLAGDGEADALEGEGRKSRLIWLKAALLPLIVVALFVVGRKLGLGSGLEEAKDWFAAHRVLGMATFVLLYTIVGVSALPGLPMTLASGVLFGSAWGIALTSFGTTLGAALAFVLARTLAREAVARWLSKKPAFAKLERWTSEQGSVVVALTRLFPIFPYSLLNYSFGLTSVRFGTYIFWTWLCMLPGTTVYVIGADVMATAMRDGRVPPKLAVIFVLALAFLLAMIPWARGRIRRGADRKE